MIFVIIQFSMFIVLLIQVNPAAISLPIIALAGVGVLIGLVAMLHMKSGNIAILPRPKDDAELITSGIYSYIRHPMYSSIFVFFLAVMLTNPTVLTGVMYGMLVVTLYLKSRAEEVYLAEQFTGYVHYRTQSKRFIPWIW